MKFESQNVKEKYIVLKTLLDAEWNLTPESQPNKAWKTENLIFCLHDVNTVFIVNSSRSSISKTVWIRIPRLRLPHFAKILLKFSVFLYILWVPICWKGYSSSHKKTTRKVWKNIFLWCFSWLAPFLFTTGMSTDSYGSGSCDLRSNETVHLLDC